MRKIMFSPFRKYWLQIIQTILSWRLTGESHTVEEFIDIVFNYFNLNPGKYVVENKQILTRKPPVKVGDASKLRRVTAWAPSLNYPDFLIQLMIIGRLENKGFTLWAIQLGFTDPRDGRTLQIDAVFLRH